MRQGAETRTVILTAADSVELEPGIIMPAGRYRGTSKRIGVRMLNGVSWTAPDYSIKFSRQKLAAMGMKNTQGVKSIDWTVTEFVRDGKIVVRLNLRIPPLRPALDAGREKARRLTRLGFLRTKFRRTEPQ